MWASVPTRNFRDLLQSWWKHFPYIWQQWGRKGGKDMVIPGFLQHSYENITWPLKPESAVAGKRGKRIYSAVLEFWFSFPFFLKSPSRYRWGRSHAFLKLCKYLGKRCHQRTERKGGDSAGLQFSTAYLQSESVCSSFSSLNILKCLSFTLQTSVLADTSLKWKVLTGICKNKMSEATVGITIPPWSLILEQECQCCIMTKINTTRDLLLLKCGQVGPAV